MKTLRRYFISDDLDDLEVVEEQLESAGVSTPQIHVLTAHDADLTVTPRLSGGGLTIRLMFPRMPAPLSSAPENALADEPAPALA